MKLNVTWSEAIGATVAVVAAALLFLAVNVAVGSERDLPTATAVRMFGTPKDAEGLTYQCSGTVIAPEVVLTAKHCLEAAKTVLRDGQQYEVVGGKISGTQDAAVLYVRGIACPCAPVASMIDVTPGAAVRAVGYPGGEWSDDEGEVLGVKAFDPRPASYPYGETLLAHTAYTDFGASGGGLWQKQGGHWLLVGVHSRIQMTPWFMISWAVPVTEIKELF